MRDDQCVVAVEVKPSRSVGDPDERHFLWLQEYDLLGVVVVTTGPKAYRRADGIAVVPAALIGP